jgi:uncharacterized protein with GYD domain
MLGKYSLEAIKGIKAERTKRVNDIIKKAGGKAQAMYALVGNYDLAFVVDFPGIAQLLKASVALTRGTGISFISSPAVSVQEFDKIIG